MTPPFVVEPLVVITTVTGLVPYEWATGWKRSVPFVLMTGNVLNNALVPTLVCVSVLNVYVCPAWLAAPT